MPNNRKSKGLCNTAVCSNWRAFLYVPKSMYTLDNCIEIFKRILHSEDDCCKADSFYINDIVRRFPDYINNENQIIKFERQLGARRFIEKFYDKTTKLFITKEYICYQEDYDIQEFNSFKKFYEHLEGDLIDANLYDFDFLGVNLNNFSIEEAFISSAVLKAQNLYDDSFYLENIKNRSHNTELIFSVESKIVENSIILHEAEFTSKLTDQSRNIYYISDIHLNHKLLRKFPLHATKLEVTTYIKNLIKNMIETTTNNRDDYFLFEDYLFIAGDISLNFEISIIFYSELCKVWKRPNRIIVVLGNHELWDFSYNRIYSSNPDSLENIIQRYRSLFADLGITFLQNDLFVLKERTPVIISEEQLKTVDLDTLKNYCLASSLVVLGGLGYSGLNQNFNATSGIYRQAILSLDDDIKHTKKFAFLYDKLIKAIGDHRVIVLTHTPKENWSSNTYNNKWIYVNGHTHRNVFYCSEEKTVYADNQIGYYNESVELKCFKISKTYDIFKYYTDGIYKITRKQYLDFYRGLNINSQFKRQDGTIHMLKNHGVYCFIFEDPKKEKIYLLNGGVTNNTPQKSINYYYKNMVHYSNAIKKTFDSYNRLLRSISNTIKQIGGIGDIHGCIIDIDTLNHIYVNATDGKITPYFAWSNVEKYTYPDIQTLLFDKRNDLYDNYIKLINNKDEGIILLSNDASIKTIKIPELITETYMYRSSRVMKSLQYLYDVNVIRIWNDEIINTQSQINSKANGLHLKNND